MNKPPGAGDACPGALGCNRLQVRGLRGVGSRGAPARAQEAADVDAEVVDELVDELLFEDVDEEESVDEEDEEDELESEVEPESELVEPDSADDFAGACELFELLLPDRESLR
ncbi:MULTISPECIES: hypothetical protein [Prauserella salsuginis group]|uniref:Uncharacterized protein n=1 Tax=Prauserella salsuginis TaxID=387889 RepID=A0ABW6G8H8_9PSEU